MDKYVELLELVMNYNGDFEKITDYCDKIDVKSLVKYLVDRDNLSYDEAVSAKTEVEKFINFYESLKDEDLEVIKDICIPILKISILVELKIMEILSANIKSYIDKEFREENKLANNKFNHDEYVRKGIPFTNCNIEERNNYACVTLKSIYDIQGVIKYIERVSNKLNNVICTLHKIYADCFTRFNKYFSEKYLLNDNQFSIVLTNIREITKHVISFKNILKIDDMPIVNNNKISVVDKYYKDIDKLYNKNSLESFINLIYLISMDRYFLNVIFSYVRELKNQENNRVIITSDINSSFISILIDLMGQVKLFDDSARLIRDEFYENDYDRANEHVHDLLMENLDL